MHNWLGYLSAVCLALTFAASAADDDLVIGPRGEDELEKTTELVRQFREEFRAVLLKEFKNPPQDDRRSDWVWPVFAKLAQATNFENAEQMSKRPFVNAASNRDKIRLTPKEDMVVSVPFKNERPRKDTRYEYISTRVIARKDTRLLDVGCVRFVLHEPQPDNSTGLHEDSENGIVVSGYSSGNGGGDGGFGLQNADDPEKAVLTNSLNRRDGDVTTVLLNDLLFKVGNKVLKVGDKYFDLNKGKRTVIFIGAAGKLEKIVVLK